MSDLITQPEAGSFFGVYPHGTLDQYNAAELDQIDKVQYAGKSIDEAQHGFQCEVIRLKQLLDGQDQADGLVPTGNGGQQPSRFWDGARAGHFGEKLKGYADNGQRQQVQRWVTANEAASILLDPCVTRVTHDLPFELARERGMGQTALCTYMRLFPEAKEMATHYFTVTGELRSDMLQEIEQIVRDFPERTAEVTAAITVRDLSVPSEFKALKEEWRKQIAIQKALMEERERQDKLEEAEKFEEEVDKQPPPEKTSNIDSSQEDVTRRKAPTPSWFKSDSGVMKTKNVVGDLPKPLADAVNGLSGLKKQLYIQRDHSSEMHDYAQFWAGYDRHAMSEAAAQRVWGQAGRLGRMEKLRKLIIEVNQMLDIYIKNTTPPENIEYPED